MRGRTDPGENTSMAMSKRKRLTLVALWGCAINVGLANNVARRQGWRFAILLEATSVVATVAIALVLHLRLLRKQRVSRSKSESESVVVNRSADR